MPGQVRYRHLCHGGGPRQPCDQRRHAQCQPGAGLRQRGLCSGDRDYNVVMCQKNTSVNRMEINH